VTINIERKAGSLTEVIDISTRTIELSSTRMTVSTSGDPALPAVLMLHGGGPGVSGLANWRGLMHDLAPHYHCVVPDMIGFGDSSHPDPAPGGFGPYVELRAQTTLELLEALGVAQPHSIGNSLGGIVTLEILRRSPERLGKIVLMGSGGAPVPPGPHFRDLVRFYAEPTRDKMSEMFLHFAGDRDAMRPFVDSVVDERFEMALRPEVERSHRATFDFSQPWSISDDELAAIENQVLVVHGREDNIVSPEASWHFFKTLPHSRLVAFSGCGHWAHIERRAEFQTALEAFFTDQL
jgi:2-hydroxymuconate-semialdehyde hydrolase